MGAIMFFPTGSFEDLQQELETTTARVSKICGASDLAKGISSISNYPFLEEYGHSKIAANCISDADNLMKELEAQSKTLEDEYPGLILRTELKQFSEDVFDIRNVLPKEIMIQYDNLVRNIVVLSHTIEILNHIVDNYAITEKNVHSILANYCSWNQADNVSKLLWRCAAEVDIITDDSYFDIAISGGYTEVLAVLLDYYEKTQLNIDQNSTKYKLSKAKLQEVLQDKTEGEVLTEKMSDLLKPYIGDVIDGNDEYTDQDLSEELDMLDFTTNSTNSPESTIWLGVDHDQDYHDHLLHNHNIEAPGTNLLGNHSFIHTQ